jgi:hypothetical protein
MGSGELTYPKLVYLEAPGEFLKETERIVSLMLPQFNFGLVRKVFEDIEKLFAGQYPGYRGCNTGYHNLNHTMHCFLLMARLMHGAFLNKIYFEEKHVTIGLISALMHDTGYIQFIEDKTGTGGKYTLVHIDRSIEFIEKYFRQNGFSLADYISCRNCLKCTGTNIDIRKIAFDSYQHEILGKILGTADLIGQMADRDYLQNLTSLYLEFREGGISIFNSDLDLLKSTPDFWEFTKQRFAIDYGSVDRYLRDHFRIRWSIDRDLDREAIERNIKCLKFILEHHETDYLKYLCPEGIKQIMSEIRIFEATA